jgi:hypothetical protein
MSDGPPVGGPGWIRVSRRLFSSDLWAGPFEGPFCARAAFIDLLQRATFTPRVIQVKGRPVQLKPGELVINPRYLSESWGWSRAKLYRFLQRLQDRGTLSSRPAWPGGGHWSPTVWSFVNWGTYQWGGETVTTQAPQGKTPTPPDRAGKAQTPPDSSVRQGEPLGDNGKRQPPGQGRETGRTNLETGKPLLPQLLSPPPRTPGERRYLEEEEKTNPLSLLSPADTQLDPGPPPDTFAAVQELVTLCDRYGRAQEHRGLNVQLATRLVHSGVSPSTVAHAIRGTRLLADAGRIPWVAPGAPFSLAAIFGRKTQVEGQSLAALAFDASRAAPAIPEP